MKEYNPFLVGWAAQLEYRLVEVIGVEEDELQGDLEVSVGDEDLEDELRNWSWNNVALGVDWFTGNALLSLHDEAKDFTQITYGPDRFDFYWQEGLDDHQLEVYDKLRREGSSIEEASALAREAKGRVLPNFLQYVTKRIEEHQAAGTPVKDVYVSREMASGQSLALLLPDSVRAEPKRHPYSKDECLLWLEKEEGGVFEHIYWDTETDSPVGEVYVALRKEGATPEQARLAQSIMG